MPVIQQRVVKTVIGNREAWLTRMASAVEPIFKGFKILPYRVTCGWPSSKGLGKKKRVIGECHSDKSSKGGFHEIFISPTLDSPLVVAGVTCHELTHVVAGIPAAHGKDFVKVCKHIGLTKGKPTQAMPGDTLNRALKELIESLGPYPHTALEPVMKEKKNKPSSTAVECPECGCRVVISFKWLEQAGLPTCGCGSLMQGGDKDAD